MINREDLIRHFDHNSAGYRLEGRHSQIACSACHRPGLISSVEKQIISIKDPARTFLGLSRDCASCHSDAHRGQLSQSCGRCHDNLNWKNAAQFDHKKARYALDGIHAKIACNKCHLADAVNQTVKYRGIEFEDCAPCHRDPHAGAFKVACNSCHHSNSDWKTTAASAVFKHSQTRFSLRGKHAVVQCNSCHRQGNFKQALAFAECRDCHKPDPHKGQFAARAKGSDCNACHTEGGFKPATFRLAQHSETRFPLRQRHSEIACAECHKSNASGVIYNIADFSCVACHSDIHESQFKGEPYKNRCEACHDESRFKPSTFTNAQHQRTRFPLSGGHTKPVCGECHKTGPRAVKFRFDDQACPVCHEDPHRDRFAARMAVSLPGGNRAGCDACHTTNSWHELDKFDHSSTKFLLAGAHQTTSCDKCHVRPSGNSDTKPKFEESVPKECSGCHDDAHNGQFVSRMAAAKREGERSGCGNCHSEVSWHDMAGFDHNSTRFALEGAHKSVACTKCHASSDAAIGVKGILYASASRTCAGCHEDSHAGQFSSASMQSDCSRCHQLQAWKPSTFDHTAPTTFSLTGAHSKVRCELCHDKTRMVSGKAVIIYTETPRKCAECHTSNSTGKQP